MILIHSDINDDLHEFGEGYQYENPNPQNEWDFRPPIGNFFIDEIFSLFVINGKRDYGKHFLYLSSQETLSYTENFENTLKVFVCFFNSKRFYND